MTPHFLSLCSHRMPQPVGGRALHPYPLHIWLPFPRGWSVMFGRSKSEQVFAGFSLSWMAHDEYWKDREIGSGVHKYGY